MNCRRLLFFILILSGVVSNAAAQGRLPNISVLQDDGTLIVPANGFDLSGRSLVFTPQGSGYAVQAVSSTFDQGAGNAQIVRIDDDDSVQFNLPFSFPFFGAAYNTIFLNSDGNVTFNTPD